MYKSYDQLGSQPDSSRDILDVLEIVNEDHKNQLIKQNKICVIDIYADWCGPCKQTAPDYSLLATTYSKPGICSMVKYNFDKIPNKEGINGIPIFLFYFDKTLVDKVIGADIALVEEKLKTLLNKIEGYNQKTQTNLQGPYQRTNSIRQNKPANTSYDTYNNKPVISSNPYTTMNFN